MAGDISKKGVRSFGTAMRGMKMFGGEREKSIEKHAEQMAAGPSGAANVQQVPAFFYSPELTPDSWLLPKSRQEILKWCRIFFNLEPYIRNGVNFWALYPMSKFDIVTPDKSITEIYRQAAFNENFDLYQYMLRAALSYAKFGEAINFLIPGEMEYGGKQYEVWKKVILLEPELVEVKQGVFEQAASYELVPTTEMTAIFKQDNPETNERLIKVLGEDNYTLIKRAVVEGKNIPLDPNNVSMIADLTDPSATRGTSMIQAVFKALIYQDKIRLAQLAIADRYHFPVELWTVGDVANEILPTDEDLEAVRAMINQSIQQPPFSMVFPPIIKYEAIGVLGKLLPVKEDLDYIQDQLMVGLGLNKGIMLGEGPSFSNMKAMSLHKVNMLAKTIRDQFENWMIYKFFAPIAKKNNFRNPTTNQLILPQISWYKSLDIEEEEAERKQYLEMWKSGLVSTKTLFSKYPHIDYDIEQKLLEQEKGTIFDKKNDRLPKDYQPGEKATSSPSKSSPEEESPAASAPDVTPPSGTLPTEEPAKPEAPATPTTETPATPTPPAPGV